MIYVSLKRSNYYVRDTWDRVSCSNHSKFHWAPINPDELTVIEVDIVPRHGEREGTGFNKWAYQSVCQIKVSTTRLDLTVHTLIVNFYLL